ncbi:MAG: hypothetical protein H5U06_09070 [Candidatus Aminicenantes bacterium]|nr:hypothetical protein [Candidatus Aminicenantes bacterium]
MYRCYGCGDCYPLGGGQSASNLSLSQQMAMSLVGAMVNSVFGNMFSNLFSSPRSSAQEAQVRQQQEEQWQREQQEKLAAYNRWLILQGEAEQKRLEEERAKKQVGQEILAKTSIGGEVKKDDLGGGKLVPFNWDAPRISATSPPAGQYDNSKMSEVERLLCASFFSIMAEKAANSGDVEGAMFYSTQMDRVMQGLPTSVECKLPPELASMTADAKMLQEINQKYARMATLYHEIMPKIEKLQDVEIKLAEALKTKAEREQRIRELENQIDEIRGRVEKAETPEKRAREEDLLAQALALKSDAENQYQEVLKTEEQLAREKQSLEQELNKIKKLIQRGGLK